ncbi:MAG: hypothetical protein SFX19_09090 [Alphaproteobacteria bacterium]|nr:hypothetical protein [Alphaproteobacteria bacterium]
MVSHTGRLLNRNTPEAASVQPVSVVEVLKDAGFDIKPGDNASKGIKHKLKHYGMFYWPPTSVENMHIPPAVKHALVETATAIILVRSPAFKKDAVLQESLNRYQDGRAIAAACNHCYSGGGEMDIYLELAQNWFKRIEAAADTRMVRAAPSAAV